jgi:hypothetical protein
MVDDVEDQPFTVVEVERLTELWYWRGLAGERMSINDIGFEMKRSRYSISKKVQRLGLTPRSEPVARRDPEAPPKVEVIRPARSIPLFTTVIGPAMTCQAISGDVVLGISPNFCGEKSKVGRSYCPVHCKMFFTGAPKPRLSNPIYRSPTSKLIGDARTWQGED